MFDSPIEEIKNRLDIVEVIGSYLKLQKTGANYRALCPFHSEKKPSFFVSPARQIFKCFGCAAYGDIFKFIMMIEGVEFGDALKTLAQKAGVELKPLKPESIVWRTKRQRLYEICELSAKFFEKQLDQSAIGKKAEDYLLKRGISEESIKKWRLGYAPDTWQGLSDFLVGKGYQREEIQEAGLAVKNEKGNYYDRFRARIIFPVFDLNSQIIGFGARVLEEQNNEGAKYINTPNTLLYDKSRVLYGINFAKMEIRIKDDCLLVEGYIDCILSHQAGFQNTIAVSGTALTPFQLRILKRYSSNLLIAFDMDIAGDSATKRGIDLAQKYDFDMKIVNLPKDSDPADIISKNPEQWEEIVNGAISILDFYFKSTFSKFNKGKPEEKKKIGRALLPVINRISNKILQSHWILRLAEELKVSEDSIISEMKKIGSDETLKDLTEPFAEDQTKKNLQKSRKELIEEKILSLMIKLGNFETISDEEIDFFSEPAKKTLSHLKKEKNISKGLKTKDAEFNQHLDTIILMSEIDDIGEPEIDAEIKNCFNELKCIIIKEKLDKLSLAINEAEKVGDKAKAKKLIEEFNKKSKSLIKSV